MRQVLIPLALAALGPTLTACDDFSAPARAAHGPAARAPAVPPPVRVQSAGAEATPPTAAVVPVAAPAPAPDSGGVPSAAPQAKLIEASGLGAASGARAGQPLLIKLEVLLDRAHFSPGAIDGQAGSNLRNATAAYEKSKGLPAVTSPNAPLLEALESADPGPVTQDYAITAEDEKGPFLGVIPQGFQALAKLDHLGYATPLEALAEKFHMSEALLRSLNPKADFAVAGTSIVVVRPAASGLGGPVAKVEVDKAAGQVRALGADGAVLAAFPATVGSTERPAPSGQWAVKTVVHDPDYSYDPRRLTFGDKSQGLLRIAPGPNNPVGSTWIALTKETYGIHGAPDPTKVGKTASHGCVRLTNWDAATLGKALTKGTPVVFLGQTSKS